MVFMVWRSLKIIDLKRVNLNVLLYIVSDELIRLKMVAMSSRYSESWERVSAPVEN